MILSFLGILGIVLLWVVYLLFQNNRKKLKMEIQNKIIEDKQKEIVDSIKYAKRIQTALMTNENYITKSLGRLNRS